MNTMFENIKAGWSQADDAADRGDLVQTVLIIAGFAIVAILLVTWIGNAITGQAADVAECIAGASGYNAGDAQEACEDNDKSQEAMDLNSSSDAWSNRFG